MTNYLSENMKKLGILYIEKVIKVHRYLPMFLKVLIINLFPKLF